MYSVVVSKNAANKKPKQNPHKSFILYSLK